LPKPAQAHPGVANSNLLRYNKKIESNMRGGLPNFVRGGSEYRNEGSSKQTIQD